MERKYQNQFQSFCNSIFFFIDYCLKMEGGKLLGWSIKILYTTSFLLLFLLKHPWFLFALIYIWRILQTYLLIAICKYTERTNNDNNNIQGKICFTFIFLSAILFQSKRKSKTTQWHNVLSSLCIC